MSQLTNIPLQDNYKSTLSQAWDGNTGTIHVNTPPSFTFPSGVKTYICVDPGKTNMQVARISAYDATLKTITVDNITLDKGNGVAYTAQTHTVGSVIEISDNYQFREDILTAMNTKVNTNSADTDTGKFADTTARDAYFTSPVEGNTAFVTGIGWTDYISGAWSTRTSSSDASTTTKGLVEIATQAETEARTATGGSGATLIPTAATLSPSNITTITPATGDKLSFADVSASNVFGSATLQTLCDIGRPLATNAQAQTGTGTTQAVTPLQLRNFAGVAPTAGTLKNAFPIVSSMTTTATTPTMKTQAVVKRDGTYRITFTGSTNFGLWHIQIYNNRQPFGTLRAGSGGATYSEDLTFVYGDVISIYMYNDSPGTCTCTNYSVQYDDYIMTNTTF